MHLKGGRFNISGLCLAGIPDANHWSKRKILLGDSRILWVDDMGFFYRDNQPLKIKISIYMMVNGKI